jgi:hypothetical protein
MKKAPEIEVPSILALSAKSSQYFSLFRCTGPDGLLHSIPPIIAGKKVEILP